MKSKIYCYWYTSRTNVGDMAAKYILEKICDLEVCYKNPSMTLKHEIKLFIQSLIHFPHIYCPKMSYYVYPWQQCLCTIGSLLDFSNGKVINWGGGFREYNSQCQKGAYYAVRGYLSKEKISSVDSVAIGDPALLLPLIIDGHYSSTKKSMGELNKIGIIAHFDDFDYLYNKYSYKYPFIDVRTNDVEAFVDRLKEFDCILSTSLHGVIISHAFGIPALWIKCGWIGSGPFKFHDYFSSVGITQYDGFSNIESILESSNNWQTLFKEFWNCALPQKDLLQISKDLLKHAPFPLKSKFRDLIG